MLRVLRFAAAVLVACLAAVTAAYVGHGIARAHDVERARHRAVADIDRSLAGGERRLARDRRDVLSGSMRPTYAWRELSCSLDTREAGWIVESYEQRCRLRSVDLVSIPSRAGASCVPVPVRQPSRADNVSVFRSPSDLLSSSGYGDYRCPHVLAPTPAREGVRLLDGVRPDRLTPGSSWLVVEVEVPLTQSDLGCNPWHLFCDPPSSSPAM